ncbi:MAG TPA: hypothetical protein VLV16_08345 [Gemmatimonadales bacterium]|nr:hypothetical protein [Gemmatimonadales bacterium]
MRTPIALALAALALAGKMDAQALRVGGSVPARVSWSKRDIALAGAFTASLLIDAAQTRALARDGWQGFREANPILGPSPSVRGINTYTAVVGLGMLGAAAMVPAHVRPWLLGAALAVEAFTISHTVRQGIPVRF